MPTDMQSPPPACDGERANLQGVQGNDAIPTGFEQAGLISGLGKFHSNKAGDQPYLRVTLADVRKMVDNPPSVDKDQAQWLIPSTLDTRVHAEQEAHGEFWMLWADVDWKALAPKPMSDVAAVVRGLIGADFEIYASRSATEDRQKCRVLIPLSKPLCGADWIMSQRVLNLLLAEAGIEPDSASEGAGQLLYLPNRGEWYDSISQREGVYFAPVSAWADRIESLRRQDAEAAAAVLAAREEAQKRREAMRAANVGDDAQTLVQAFKAAYTVEDILLQAGYDQQGQRFRHPKSDSGNFSASVKDGRVHTLSSADRLYTGGGGGGAHDAFSAFQVLFHQGDIGAALRNAGDKWLMIGAESWNEVSRRKREEGRRAERDAGPGVEQQEPEARQEFDYNLSEVPHIEWGIDGFTSTGLTVIAGEAGLGKTSTVVPLAAAVAHLIYDPNDSFSLNPVLRRKVVYVTEDAGQVQSILYGLRHHRSQASNQEFRDWFHVIESHRKSADELGSDILRWREEFRYTAGQNLNHFVVEPLIIIDTSNANIDLDNENDNAEVGRAIAAIKRAVEGGRGMAWIVAHLPKNVSREDIAKLTPRGASAWVGDVNATVFLISDPALDGKRFLVLGKRRFEPEYTEMEVVSEVHSCVAVTPWGERQNRRYVVCDLKGLTRKDSRAVQAAKAQSESYAKDIVEFLTREYEVAQKDGGAWSGMTGGRIEKGVAGKAANVRQSLAEMVKAGALQSKTEGHHATAPTFYWLPSQNRVSPPNAQKGRSRDEATPKSAQKDEPSCGGFGVVRASSPYREGTKDEGGTLSGVTPPAFDSSESGRSRDEAGTKGTKLENEDWQSHAPMANSSAPNVPAGWAEV